MRNTHKNTNIRKALLGGISIVALTTMVGALPAYAVDESANIEAGTATTIDGADTFVIDVTNDGEGAATVVTFNSAGANSLTITSDGADATDTADTGGIGSIAVTDGGAGATNAFILNDATNADGLTLAIAGDIAGNVATDANDLTIVVNALTTNDTGNSTLDVNGNVDLGTGTITLTGDADTLTGDADDTSILLVSGAANQMITGAVISTTDDTGSSVVINNGANTVTFASAVGAAGGDGIEILTVGDATAGGQAVFSDVVNAAAITVGGATAASSADFNGNVEGATVALTAAGAGAVSANFAGDVAGTTALTKSGANDATATYDGAAAQTITGVITAANDGDGIVAVTNTGGIVTFDGNIGAVAGNAVGSVTVASGSTIDIDGDVSADTITGGGTINVSGTAEVETATDLGAAGTAFTISVDAGQTLTTDAEADGTVFAEVTLDGAGSTLVLGGANETNLTGNVVAGADGEGVLTVAGADGVTTITGNIGTTAADIDTLNGGANGVNVIGNTYAETITGAAGVLNFDGNVAAATSITAGAGDITVTGDVTSASIVLDTGDDLTTDGTGAQTITGAITTGTDGGGAISNTNAAGLVTFASAIGVNGANNVGTITLANDSKTVFSETVDAGDLVLGTGEVTIEKAVNLTADGAGTGILTTANGSTVNLGSTFVDGTTAITAAGDSTATLDQTAGAVTLNMSSAFTSGTVTLYDSGTALDAADLAAFTVNDSALVNYTLVAADGTNDIAVTAAAKAAADAAAELGTTADSASALLNANAGAIASGDTTVLSAISSSLNAGGAEAKKAAEQIGIQADTLGAGTTAMISTGSQALGAASTRLASNRSGAQYASAGQTGFAAGDGSADSSFWFKPFGNLVSQDSKGGVSGYDADTYGLAVGADTAVSDDVTVGAFVAYSSTDVDGDGAGNSNVDINSYQVSLYADYTQADYYVEGMVGYARNDSDTTRSINFGGLSRTAVGTYDSDQYMARVNAGMPINVEGNTFITPMAGLAYTHVSADSYTETGAGNLNLNVASDDVNSLVASLGAKLHTNIRHNNGMLVPSAKLGVTYDVAGDEAEATGTYTGGGAAFNVKGAEVEELGGNAGLGLAYDGGAWSLRTNYDAEFKSDYMGHSGTVEVRFNF
jgi:outer membrane autotransporter protein